MGQAQDLLYLAVVVLDAPAELGQLPQRGQRHALEKSKWKSLWIAPLCCSKGARHTRVC